MASALPSLPPLPVLPLLLWETPPGLELILAQEGVPFVRVRDRHPWAFRGGRFVLYDGRRAPAARGRAETGGPLFARAGPAMTVRAGPGGTSSAATPTGVTAT